MRKFKSKVSNLKTWVEIDTAALRHNLHAAQKLVGPTVTVMAVVKSNAYGHGLAEVARVCASRFTLHAPRIWFGVDSIDEALILKEKAIKQPIFILGYIPKPRLEEAILYGFRFVLYDADVLTECARIAKKLNKKAFVHVKVETGTYRQGVLNGDARVLARLLKRHAARIVSEGIYTHFADSENTKSTYYKYQLAEFGRALRIFTEEGISFQYKHASSSAGLLIYPEAHFNMVRLGIALYGMYPSENVQSRILNKVRLRPVFTWKTRVAQVKEVPKGATVGYDRTYKAKRARTIAILPVGYWDGCDRRLSNEGITLIRGKRAPVVGNICMNMMMVDVTRIRGARAGDEVVLLGREGEEAIPAEEMARAMGTINYEITTRINPCIPRILL